MRINWCAAVCAASDRTSRSARVAASVGTTTVTVPTLAGSVSPGAAEESGKGLEEDPDVASERHPLDVVELDEAEPPKDAADARDPGVVAKLEGGLRQRIDVHEVAELVRRAEPHRAQLVHLERPPVEPGAQLAEDRRARAVEPNGERDEGEERRQDREGGRRE